MEEKLKIEDVKVGTGKEVKTGDSVTVHYTGWLTDGTKFDSSKDRDQKFTTKIGMGYVIRGWDEGIIGMKEGGVRKLTIPYDMAYGKYGSGPIPGFATLIFEIELFEVK